MLDPLSPDNVDFAVLGPTWLAVAAVTATGVLFAATFAALAARLDAVIVGARGWRGWSPCVVLPLMLVPMLATVAVTYVGGRLVARGRARDVLARPGPMMVGRVLVGAGAIVTIAIAVVAVARISAA